MDEIEIGRKLLALTMRTGQASAHPNARGELAKLDIQIDPEVTDASPNEGDVIVCMKYTGGEMILPDNILGECKECGTTIQFRPYLSEAKGDFMCIECALFDFESN